MHDDATSSTRICCMHCINIIFCYNKTIPPLSRSTQNTSTRASIESRVIFSASNCRVFGKKQFYNCHLLPLLLLTPDYTHVVLLWQAPRYVRTQYIQSRLLQCALKQYVNSRVLLDELQQFEQAQAIAEQRPDIGNNIHRTDTYSTEEYGRKFRARM